MSRHAPPSRLRRAFASLGVQVLALFFFTTLGALAVAFVQTRGDTLTAERRAFADALAVADSAAQGIEGILQFARQTAHVLEGLPAFWDGSDADRDAVLTILADAEPIFNGLTYFTADFRDHGRSHFDPAVGRLDVSNRAYAREVVASGQLTVSDETVVGLARGRPAVLIAIPVREGGGQRAQRLHDRELAARPAPRPSGRTCRCRGAASCSSSTRGRGASSPAPAPPPRS